MSYASNPVVLGLVLVIVTVVLVVLAPVLVPVHVHVHHVVVRFVDSHEEIHFHVGPQVVFAHQAFGTRAGNNDGFQLNIHHL